MAASKRFYAIRTETEGMAGLRQFHAVLAEEPETAPNLTVREVAASTPLAEWAEKTPDATEPPALT